MALFRRSSGWQAAKDYILDPEAKKLLGALIERQRNMAVAMFGKQVRLGKTMVKTDEHIHSVGAHGRSSKEAPPSTSTKEKQRAQRSGATLRSRGEAWAGSTKNATFVISTLVPPICSRRSAEKHCDTPH